MERPPLGPSTLKVHVFAKREFAQLKADLYTNGVKITAQEDLVGALVLAARRAAIGEIKAAVLKYWERTAAIEAASGSSVKSEDDD